MSQSTRIPSDRGVYSISVASELSGVGLQTLRLYERRQLITPTRTSGGTRRYSENDIRRIQRVTALVDDGVNLPGVQRILVLEDRCESLCSQLIANGLVPGDDAPIDADVVQLHAQPISATE